MKHVALVGDSVFDNLVYVQPGPDVQKQLGEALPYEWSGDWIEERVRKMIDVLNSTKLPEPTPSCENCAYAHQRAAIE